MRGKLPTTPPSDPCRLLETWLDVAERESGITNWNAMMLATVGADGRPSVRPVLLKAFDAAAGTLSFYTNYTSRKAREIEANPAVAMVMHWDPLERQVRVEGTADRVSDATSDEYFATRPRVSQIGAWASDQSEPLESPGTLLRRVAATGLKYTGRTIPRPEHWGGYRITATMIEFWQAGKGRVHRRLRYERDGDAWQATWLYP